MTDTDWLSFLAMARQDLDRSRLGTILCLDPGETTGWALWQEGELVETGQEPTGRNPALMSEFIRSTHEQMPLDQIVYEEYRIRGNKAQQHIGSEVVTIQHIGVILAISDMLDIPTHKQSAGMAKGFATDAKLRRWGLYQTGLRHANDAVRHGVYYILFNSTRYRP